MPVNVVRIKNMSLKFKIRPAIPADAAPTYELIRELALYEKALDAVTNSLEQYKNDAFEQDLFELIVAEEEESGQILGMALYFMCYSTWKGKQLYLDDLVVKEAYRGNGIGQALIDELFAVAKKENVHCMRWQVLDWNTPAVEFYEKLGAKIDKEWWDCKFYRTQIENYSGR